MEKIKQKEMKYHLKLRVYYEERNFGPGVADLMKLVRERGSLSEACQELHMAYSKAWKIIKKAEADLGFSLMEGRRGGENGGTTVLTVQGEKFLEQYVAFSEAVEMAAEESFYKYFPQ